MFSIEHVFALQDEDLDDDYKSADGHMPSTLEHDPADSIDYSEEPRLPVEEAVREEPPAPESQFIAMARDAGVAPGDEANQPGVMGAPPPSVITQTNMMRYTSLTYMYMYHTIPVGSSVDLGYLHNIHVHH